MRFWPRFRAFLSRHYASPVRRNSFVPAGRIEPDWARQQAFLQRVRHELVELSVTRHRLESQIERLRLRARRAEERACQAVADGIDDRARFLLMRKRATLRQLALLEPQLLRILSDEQRLVRRVRLLTVRLEEVRELHRTLVARDAARYVRLEIASRGNPALDSSSSTWQLSEAGRNRRTA